MNTFKTQNLHTAAIFAALSETFANDYLTESRFLSHFFDRDEDCLKPEELRYFDQILRIGKTARIALDAICMTDLYNGISKESKHARFYYNTLKDAGPRVYDDIQIGGLKLLHKHFLDKFLKYDLSTQ